VGAAALLAQGFTETTQAVVVEVPVQVVRGGEPVRGLTAADFALYDGSKPQRLTGFDVLDLAAPAAAGRPAVVPAIAARRHFLLLFDLSYSEPRSLARAREATRNVVLRELQPSDLVAVATYSSASGPQLVLGFTSDRGQVETALAGLGLPQLVDRASDPLRLVAAEMRRELLQQPLRLSGKWGNHEAFEQMVLEQLEQFARESQGADLTARRNGVTALTRSFADLAKMMNNVAGRKYVVYLSEGFDSSILTGSTDKEQGEQSREAAAAGEIQKVNSEAVYGDTTATNNVERMLEQFRRADCVIQAVDIGGLRATGDLEPKRGAGQETLLQMAKDTGGELYQNFNDLGAAMEQMLKKTSVTYVLAFQPEGLQPDGSYHPIRVELKNAPRGTRVVSRPGYYAPKPYSARSPLEKLLEAANRVMGREAGALSTAVLAAPFDLGGERAYVPVFVEIDGGELLAGSAGDSLPAEVYAYALDATGAVRDFFTQTLTLDLAKVAPALRQGGLKFFGHLDLPPGSYSLRVLVRNGTTGAYGLRAAALEVLAFAAGKPALLPPFFPEAPGRWLLVHEAPRGAEVPYPFTTRSQPYVPAVRPVLAPGEETKLALLGWNLGTGEPRLTTRVLAADGKELAPGELRLVARETAEADELERLEMVFRPPALPPGEYRLVVTLSGAGAAGTATAAFAVGAPARGGHG
jgi:VWFA-related protein